MGFNVLFQIQHAHKPSTQKGIEKVFKPLLPLSFGISGTPSIFPAGSERGVVGF